MDLNNVMKQLADQLDTIADLRINNGPADQVQVPAAVVGFPDTLTYDETYGRGMDRLQLPVAVLVAKVASRNANKQIAKYAAGTGASSIKAVLESGTYTAFDTCRVMRAEFDVITIGGVDYLGITFAIDIAGQGAS